MGDTSATKNITHDPGGLEDYELATVGQCVEGAGGFHPPIDGYGYLRPLVDQRVGDIRGPARELALECVADVLSLGQDNLPSVKRLGQSFDVPMRDYPAVAVIPPTAGADPSSSDLSDRKRTCRDQGSPPRRRI